MRITAFSDVSLRVLIVLAAVLAADAPSVGIEGRIEVVLARDADPAGDALLVLRVAAAAARADLPVAPHVLVRLQDCPAVPQPWPAAALASLVEVLAAGPPAVHVLEALDQAGLLVRLLPEWATVRSKPQRNSYHRFTVDRHLVETASEAAALTREVARPDLLLLGALLHDIGKGTTSGQGQSGDHTLVGMEVVAEMAPKSWAIAHPEKSALLLARPFRFFVSLLRPLIRILNGLANITVKAVGVEPQDERAMAHSPSDLLLLIEESAGHGGIAAEEHKLFARSLELSGLIAADAMTARRDIVAVGAEVTAEFVAAEAHRTGRTRVVVHEGDLDHVRGFVHAKDVLRLENGTWSSTQAGSLTRPIMVTPEHHGLEDLLLEMRTRRQHISLVVDEHGMVLGLVTLEDVIEELIGDFDDESDRRLGDAELLDDGVWRIPGTMRVELFAECTGVALPDGDWQTVAGYVIDVLDEIPAQGECVRTELGEFRVVAMDGYAIETLHVRLGSVAHDAVDDVADLRAT